MGWPVFGLPPWKKFSAADSRSYHSAQEDGCSSLPCRDVLSFRSEGRETLGNETARVIRLIFEPVKSALLAIEVSGMARPRHFGFVIRSRLTRSPRRRGRAEWAARRNQ